jgi:hypothetical protein
MIIIRALAARNNSFDDYAHNDYIDYDYKDF